MSTVGYLYVSALEHNGDYQRDLLHRHGVDRLFEDVATSASSRRSELARALDALRDGDTLVVWRLDRLGSSSASVISLLTVLFDRRVALTSLDERFDTAGSEGEVIGRTLRALSALERHIVRERTLERVYVARSRGRSGGRPRALSDANRARAVALRDQGASIREIAEELGTSRATIYRALSGVDAETDAAPRPSGGFRLTGPVTDGDALSAPG